MNEYDVKKYLNNLKLVDERIEEFIEKKVLKKESSKGEIKGHITKAENNLDFIKDNMKLNYLDWSITGCYYACYHAALALILTKGYNSKNHLATLLVLIKEFYKDKINEEDLELLVKFLDYQDVLFYVESKNKREDATYSTKTKFEKREVEQLRIKAVMFVSKIKNILNEEM